MSRPKEVQIQITYTVTPDLKNGLINNPELRYFATFSRTGVFRSFRIKTRGL